MKNERWYLVRLFFLAAAIALGWVNYKLITSIVDSKTVPFIMYPYTIFMGVFFISVVGFLRKSCSKVWVSGEYLCVRNYLGLSFKKSYLIKDLEGFKNMRMVGRKRKVDNYFCILYKGKIRVKVMRSMHWNYLEIKSQLAPQLHSLGSKDYNMFTSLIENLFF